jgi:hypothetical protein
VMIAVSALGIESAALRNRFKQRGLAAAVLTNEERDPASKSEVDSMQEGADIERVFRLIDLFWQARDSLKKRGARSSPRKPPPFCCHRMNYATSCADRPETGCHS